MKMKKKIIWKLRGHTELNHGPLDLQSNALPLSYTPADAEKAQISKNKSSK